jgi:RNA polymerase sigma factor (sigma-70 family)
MSRSEKDALLQILKDHKGILIKIIRSYCKNQDDWKDLEQEIIVQIWKSLKSYDPQYKMSTWIYRIALNVAISHYRRDKKRQGDTPIEDVIFTLTEETSHDEHQEKVDLLYRFIGNLNEFDKAMVILYLEDRSHSDIASIMGITTTNVGTRLSRIKNKLRTSITQSNEY